MNKKNVYISYFIVGRARKEALANLSSSGWNLIPDQSVKPS
jgi:hypothetical protein